MPRELKRNVIRHPYTTPYVSYTSRLILYVK